LSGIACHTRVDFVYNRAVGIASRNELLEACRVLFGRGFDPSFLDYLQESGLRAAWRLKALQTHPDRFIERTAKHRHSQRFIEARRAYGVLNEHLGRRARQSTPEKDRATRAAATNRKPPSPPGAGTPRTPGHRQGDYLPAAVPRRRLRLGEYLYHTRVVSFSALIEALVWQRRQRDCFGEVSRRWGLLSDDEVLRLLSERCPYEPIGATARRLGLLTAFQVRTVLTFQRFRQQPIGTYFVHRGHLSSAALDSLLHRLERHNTAFPRG
jgi:hypothetical protein